MAACEALADGSFIAAIADGAGSATMAERGAELVVQTVIRMLSEGLTAGRTDLQAVLKGAATEARRRVLDLAQELQSDARQLASTLLAVAVGPAGFAALQVGDGVIAVRQAGDGWCWVFWPQRGEYANTTHFLTDEDFDQHIQVDSPIGAIADLALMSDGLEPLALHYASKSVFEPFFDGVTGPLIASDGLNEVPTVCAGLQSFLSSHRVGTRTDDDVSLIIATCREPGPRQ